LSKDRRQALDAKFKILHVIVELPVGGVENLIARSFRCYDRGLFDPLICCIGSGGPIADTLRSEGYEVILLNRMRSKKTDFKAVSLLYKVMKEKRVDIVQTHQYHANFYGRIAARLAGVPCIVASVHNIYTRDRKIHRRLINKVLSLWTDRVAAVSKAVSEDVLKYDRLPESLVQVVYNGIPLEEFARADSREEARKLFHLPSDRIIVGSAGRLVQQKGYRFLIESVAGLQGCSLALAGDGPLREELEEYARMLKVEVFFLGMLSPDRVPLFLKSLDIFCSPSLWEGFGLALCEALAAGLPVVASDIAPFREVLGDEGALVSPADAVSLNRTLRGLIEDPAQREMLGKRAVARADIFSIQRMVKSYEELFIGILQEKRNSGA
jgi:glycosyltransferase involved in cell wall biosynthesis